MVPYKTITCTEHEGITNCIEGNTTTIELIRSTPEEKAQQIQNVEAFQAARSTRRSDALAQLQAVARARGNVFESLLNAVKTSSLGQISHALYAVGGEYRRNM